jgi:hypothetical protein
LEWSINATTESALGVPRQAGRYKGRNFVELRNLAIGHRHHWERKMALLKRELHRQVKGPEITHADRCTLVFDTDTKRLYVESEVAHFEAKVGGTVEYQTTTMDIADYLTQGGQTAGHRELWRLLRALFNENSDSAEYTNETSPAAVDVYQI